MEQVDDEPLSGDVEMDEMYVGGKARLKDKRQWNTLPTGAERRSASKKWTEDKRTPVFGMVQRGGKVSAYVVPSTQGETLEPHVTARVLDGSVIYTDEANAYVGIAKRRGYDHKRIHHAAKVYVVGDVHTNTIEGFWSLVKRGIGGTHHAVSAKYLQGYLNEYVWRYNHRDDGQAQFLSLLLRAALPL